MDELDDTWIEGVCVCCMLSLPLGCTVTHTPICILHNLQCTPAKSQVAADTFSLNKQALQGHIFAPMASLASLASIDGQVRDHTADCQQPHFKQVLFNTFTFMITFMFTMITKLSCVKTHV